MKRNLASLAALSMVLLATLLVAAGPIQAQSGTPRVQVFTGTVNDNAEVVLYNLRGLPAGHTLYAYAQATSGGLDTYLGLGTSGFARVLREDDDSGGNYNAALSYTIVEAGDYQLAVTRYDETTAGGFRLLIGLDEPAILNGRGTPTGAPFAVEGGTAARSAIPLNGMGINFTDCSVLEERPQLSGPEETLETRFFILHYTRSGADAVTSQYAAAVAAIIDSVWKREINEFGWPAPPADCGEGGDTRYDVYLIDTLADGTMLGYTEPQALLGDNPATSATEGWASYSYLAIENDFDNDPDALALMRATLAHEFHHAIQFGYDLNDIGGQWYYEATATWMETQVFPEEEDASPYVGDLFATPDLCVGSTPADGRYDMRVYAEWLLIDSLARDYGRRAVQRLWELIVDHEGMASFYALAEELGTTPQQIIQRYAIRNLLRDYALADNFNARVRVESLVEGPGEVRPRQSGVQPLAVDYVLVTQPGIYTFEIYPPNLRLVGVGVIPKTAEAHVYTLGQRATLNTMPYPYTYLLVLNPDTFEDNAACPTVDWRLTVRDGRGQTLVGNPKRWPAPHFAPTR